MKDAPAMLHIIGATLQVDNHSNFNTEYTPAISIEEMSLVSFISVIHSSSSM